MKNSKTIVGQWYGIFNYGPEYGPGLEGENVIFSFLIHELPNGQFKGKCIEFGGIGASDEISIIQGFIEDDFISFTKEYQTYTSFDENYNEVPYTGPLPPRISYRGNYDPTNNTYKGTWELWSNEESYGYGTFVDVTTGIWEMGRDSASYGL